jgi:CRP-like cAMP-binding protein
MLEDLMEHLLVFEGFSPEQLALLRPLFTLFYFPAGIALFEQGDSAECFFLLTEGEAAIRYKPEDGPQLDVAHVRPVAVVGWSAAIGTPRYTSSAVCLTNSQVLRVSPTSLRQLYETDPITGAMFLERLATLIEARLRSKHPQLMALLEQGLSVKLDRPVLAS